MEVYIEFVLLDNIAVNCIILFACRMPLKDKKKLFYVLLSALIGAIYALIMPLISVLEVLPFKLLLALLMVFTAFEWKSVKYFLRMLFAFFGATFLAVGSAISLHYLSGAEMFAENGIFYSNSFAVRGILYAGVLVLLYAKKINAILQNKHINGHVLAMLEIVTQRGTATVSALIDSGNILTEKKSGLPVAVVQKSSIKDILPREFFDGLADMENTKEQILLIPYRSLGKKEGAMLGFIPLQAKIIRDSQCYCCSCAIGVCEEPLSGDGVFSAVIHPLMLKEAHL